MARPSELHFRSADTWLCGNFSISVQKKNLSVQKICCTTVTERTLVKVLSLSTWGNSYPRTKRELLFIILKIPPFSYALLWFQVVVPSFFGARLWHAHTLFSAVNDKWKSEEKWVAHTWELGTKTLFSSSQFPEIMRGLEYSACAIVASSLTPSCWSSHPRV